MKHSPTPWNVGIEQDEARRFPTVAIRCDNEKHGNGVVGFEIAEMSGRGGNQESDAAYIVRAVNAHEKLIEALNAVEHDISMSNGLHSVDEQTVHLVYDAIAAAKGKP